RRNPVTEPVTNPSPGRSPLKAARSPVPRDPGWSSRSVLLPTSTESIPSTAAACATLMASKPGRCYQALVVHQTLKERLTYDPITPFSSAHRGFAQGGGNC